MQNYNLLKMKKDCYLAIGVPSILFGIYQIIVGNRYSLAILAFGLAIAVLSLFYILRIFSRLENMTWREQLSTVIKSASSPLLISSNEYKITYSNETFQRTALITLIEQTKTLTAFLSKVCGKAIPNAQKFLETLNTKVKVQVTWSGYNYDCFIMPLLSPANTRYGFLIEFIEIKNEASPVDESKEQMIEQLDAGFMYVNSKDEIEYLNLHLKILLSRHQSWLESLNLGFEMHSMQGQSVNTLLSVLTENKLDLPTLKRNGIMTVTLDEKAYQLHFKPLYNSHQEIMGTMIMWLDANTAEYSQPMMITDYSEIKHTFAQLHLALEGLNNLVVADTDPSTEIPFEHVIKDTQKALLQTIDFSETITLVAHQLHENYSNLSQLQELMMKLAQKESEGLIKPQQYYFDIISLMDSIKADLNTSKIKLTELLKNLDAFKKLWNESLINLKQHYEQLEARSENPEMREKLHCILQYSLMLHHRIEEIALLQNAVESETPALHTQFKTTSIRVDENKRIAEDVLLEGLK